MATIQSLQDTAARTLPPPRTQAPEEPGCKSVPSRPGSPLSRSRGRSWREGRGRPEKSAGGSRRSHIEPRRRTRGRSQTPRADKGPRSQESLSSIRSSSPHHRARSLDRRVEELDRQLRALRGNAADPFADLEVSLQPALSLQILRTTNPAGFKMPPVEPYEGAADPRDHVESFRTLMLLHGASDALLCKAFPATFRGPARAWFAGLEPGSIHSFDQFTRLFICHFAVSSRRRLTSDSLFDVRQGEGESLRDYLTRFNKATLEVRNLSQEVALSALKRGFRKGKLTFSLDKRLPKSFPELLARANHYADAEEALLLRNKEVTETTSKMGKKRRKESRPKRSLTPIRRRRSPSPRRRPDIPRPRTPPRRYERYTPLSVPRAKILMEIKGREELPHPRKLRKIPGKRTSKAYCEYHRDNGHDTEDCFQLRDEIEALIRRGRLGRYVNERRPQDGERRPDPAPSAPREENRPIAGVIQTITGGCAGTLGGGDTSSKEIVNVSAKRQKGNNVISFTDEDVEGVRTPHDDAVVISLTIANYDVRRVLVDNGSSADILFYEAFQRMNLSTPQMRKISTPLVGFTGDAVPVEGVIELSVTAGSTPAQATVHLGFLVVRTPSAYNAILGRPGLNALRAIVSTYHLLVRFPTGAGVGEIRGDQVMARQCYMATLKGKRPAESMNVEALDARDEVTLQRGEPAEGIVEVPLDESNPSRTVQVGANLDPEARARMVDFLRAHSDVFAWSASDMPGIDPDVISHALNIDPTHPHLYYLHLLRH